MGTFWARTSISGWLAASQIYFKVTRARFSKVPKLYGPLSGVTIPFVSQETSQSFFFLLLWKPVERSAFKNKRLAVPQMAFRARNIFGTFEKRAPRSFKGRGFFQVLNGFNF